jgi:hypothetical protein
MTTRPPLYGLLAEFDSPVELLAAVRRAYEAGYRRMDAYTPFPVEGLAAALGFHRSRMPLVVLIGGIVGCFSGYFMQYYVSVISYPINVGGRPLNSWPAFIPVTFELTVLIASLAAVLGMLGLNGLPQPHHPLFNIERFALATRDHFFLCIEAVDPQFDQQNTRTFLDGVHARQVSEVPYTG